MDDFRILPSSTLPVTVVTRYVTRRDDHVYGVRDANDLDRKVNQSIPAPSTFTTTAVYHELPMSQEPEDVKPKLNLTVVFEGECMLYIILHQNPQ